MAGHGMTGHKIKVSGVKLSKSGKIEPDQKQRKQSVSERIRQRKSKKQRIVKRSP
jgi:hypothetical protein